MREERGRTREKGEVRSEDGVGVGEGGKEGWRGGNWEAREE